jgi:membrane fusion protein (multidrug efflux system)
MKEAEQSEKDARKKRDPRKRRRLVVLGSLAVIFIAVGIAYGLYWALVLRYEQSTDDAYVAGNRVAVMAQEKGTAVAVLADDTTQVHRGQTLVRLDDSNARIAVQQAKAGLAAAVRRTEALYATEKQLQAGVAKGRATLDLARSDYARNRKMHKLGYYPTEKLQHSKTLVDVDERSLAAAKQALRAVHAKLANTDLAGNPRVRAAAAHLRAAWLALKRTRIVAPISGMVAKRSVQVGHDVAPGTALMQIVPLNQLWVDANFKESALGSIHVGQPVVMQADVYGSSVDFHGRVLGIGAGTGSAFSLLPPQNATGNWIKVVQRVPVRIGIAKADLARHPLRIGLSMDVTVETNRHQAQGEKSEIVDPRAYKTTVYKKQTDGANRLIAQIIAANTVGNPAKGVAVSGSGHKAGASHGD